MNGGHIFIGLIIALTGLGISLRLGDIATGIHACVVSARP